MLKLDQLPLHLNTPRSRLLPCPPTWKKTTTWSKEGMAWLKHRIFEEFIVSRSNGHWCGSMLKAIGQEKWKETVPERMAILCSQRDFCQLSHHSYSQRAGSASPHGHPLWASGSANLIELSQSMDTCFSYFAACLSSWEWVSSWIWSDAILWATNRMQQNQKVGAGYVTFVSY